jgi:glutamine synthetase
VTPASVHEFLRANDARYLLAQFVDVHGAAKAKAVPVEHADMVFGDGAGFAGFALWGFGMGPNGPDYMAVGDPDTLSMVPWMPGYARVACYGHVKGTPYEYCSRALDALAAEGLTLYTGIEPEFMLLARSADGTLAPADATDTLEKPCYDYKGLARATPFLGELTSALRASGIDVYQIDHEDSNGQFEVNFTYADAMRSADNYTFVKMAASEIARKHGMLATFMPKPFANRAGTGSHFHISVGDATTRNLFFDAGDKHGLNLSQMGYWFTGGLLAHARALAAVCAPTVNSYKRLVVGRALSGATWAPAHIAYGDNNRTACVRIPGGRIEFRLPDGSCNPYLATAAIVAAGMDGVRRKLDPGPPNNTDLYQQSREALDTAGVGLLPQSLGEAIDAFEADPVVRGALGEALAREFATLKRMEWVEYSRDVSGWETRRYLEMF